MQDVVFVIGASRQEGKKKKKGNINTGMKSF